MKRTVVAAVVNKMRFRTRRLGETDRLVRTFIGRVCLGRIYQCSVPYVPRCILTLAQKSEPWIVVCLRGGAGCLFVDESSGMQETMEE